jgi:hypothetical protein
MAKRFVAELPRKPILCAGSELATRVLRKVFSPTLFPTNAAVAYNIIGETSQIRVCVGIGSVIFSSSAFCSFRIS